MSNSGLQKGVNLRLYLNGRQVDIRVIETLISVQIRTSTNGPAAGQLTFELKNSSKIHNAFLFSGGNVRKETRIAVVVMLSGTEHVLIDGVVTNHQLTPGARPGVTTLTLTTEDLTRVMDYEERDGRKFPNQSLATRIRTILGTYSAYNIQAMVKNELHRDVEPQLTRVAHQRGTDLAYIRCMSELAGYVFFLESTILGRVTAYWGPEIVRSDPLPALSVDMGVSTNVESMNFAYDSESAEDPRVESGVQSDRSVRRINTGDRYELNTQLGAVQPPAKRKTKLRGTAKFSDAKGKLAGQAVAARSSNSVTAEGMLDTLRYGYVLKPRRMIDVRGATEAFNGTWVVRSVTHQIARGLYKQQFKLIRNSLAPTQRRVSKPTS